MNIYLKKIIDSIKTTIQPKEILSLFLVGLKKPMESIKYFLTFIVSIASFELINTYVPHFYNVWIFCMFFMVFVVLTSNYLNKISKIH